MEHNALLIYYLRSLLVIFTGLTIEDLPATFDLAEINFVSLSQRALKILGKRKILKHSHVGR